jgi:hypothetical protein
MQFVLSFIAIKNNFGDKLDPCGIPFSCENVLEVVLLSFISRFIFSEPVLEC